MPGAGARAALLGSRFADVRHVAETDSTNERLLVLARAGAPEGVVLVADHQTRGRGRRRRDWVAPPGSSLLVSALLRPPLAPARAHLVGLVAALAASDACAEVAGFRPALKWPNDVVVAGPGGTRKLAGVLVESVTEGATLGAVVVGMGLNLVVPPELAPEVAAVAVAASEVAGRPVGRDHLLVSWLGHLDRGYAGLCQPRGAAAAVSRYGERCGTLGQVVRVETATGTFEGRAVDLTADAHLVVEVGGGGATRTVAAADDVVHLRPAG
ncbi:MAG: biotin--[acetyl-CoA-carboxylase] ligase [Acidimicrobiales bacterium]